MTEFEQAWEGIDQAEARRRVVLNFDKVIHDLHCLCGTADLARAVFALDRCGWAVSEAFSAWYDSWMAGDRDA